MTASMVTRKFHLVAAKKGTFAIIKIQISEHLFTGGMILL